MEEQTKTLTAATEGIDDMNLLTGPYICELFWILQLHFHFFVILFGKNLKECIHLGFLKILEFN